MAFARREERSVSRLQLEKCAESGVQALARVLPASVTLSRSAAGPVAVEADATELQQVLFNLVLNARDAMPNGGSIEVLTGVETLEQPLPVVGGTLPSGRWAVLRVVDSGTALQRVPSVNGLNDARLTARLGGAVDSPANYGGVRVARRGEMQGFCARRERGMARAHAAASRSRNATG